MSHGVVPGALAEGARGAIAPLARALARGGVSANAVTAAGCAITITGAALVASDQPLAGAAVLLLGTGADALDGQVARASGGGTRVGAFLDSVLDRVSDAALAFAAIWLGIARDDRVLLIGGSTMLVASFLVSYARAKAESLGLPAQVGPAPREARVALYLAGIALWGLTGSEQFFRALLVVIAILTTLTLVERIVHVIKTLQKEGN